MIAAMSPSPSPRRAGPRHSGRRMRSRMTRLAFSSTDSPFTHTQNRRKSRKRSPSTGSCMPNASSCLQALSDLVFIFGKGPNSYHTEYHRMTQSHEFHGIFKGKRGTNEIYAACMLI